MATKSMDWFYDFMKTTAKPAFKKVKKMDRDDYLATIGLERRNVGGDIAGTLGLLLVGAGIGICAGLFLARKPGDELRKDVTERFNTTANSLKEKVSSLRAQAEDSNVPSTYNS